MANPQFQMGRLQFIILSLLLTLCSAVLVLPVIRSGLTYSYGIGFWGPNGHDAIWHLSLANHISTPFHIPQPSYSGSPLINYHPLYDILLAYTSRLSGLPTNILYFQVFPIITSFLLLSFSFIIVFKLTNNYYLGLFAIFLNTFSNSFGPLYRFLTQGTFSGESLFWSMQPISVQLNPPLALSLVLFLWLIYLVVSHRQTPLISIIILSLIPITKIYTGAAAFIFYGLYTLYSLHHRQFLPLKIIIFSSLMAVIFFSSTNSSSGGLIEFRPLWLIETMLQSPDRFYIPKIASAIYNLKLSNPLSPKLFFLYAFGASVFLIGNYSFRLFSLLGTLKPKININYHFFIFTSFFLTLLSLLFIQKSTAWNTIQFVYPAIILLNLSLCLYLNTVRHSIVILIFLSVTIIYYLFCSQETFKTYLGNPSPSAIPPTEVTAFKFLNTLKPGIVLTVPFDSYLKTQFTQTPLPLFAYETTAYLSAYTSHQSYLSDEMNLQNSGYDVAVRRLASGKFFEQKNIFQDRGFLLNNNIDFIYLPSLIRQRYSLDITSLSLTTLYDDGQTLIYRVQK